MSAFVDTILNDLIKYKMSSFMGENSKDFKSIRIVWMANSNNGTGKNGPNKKKEEEIAQV